MGYQITVRGSWLSGLLSNHPELVEEFNHVPVDGSFAGKPLILTCARLARTNGTIPNLELAYRETLLATLAEAGYQEVVIRRNDIGSFRRPGEAEVEVDVYGSWNPEEAQAIGRLVKATLPTYEERLGEVVSNLIADRKHTPQATSRPSTQKFTF